MVRTIIVTVEDETKVVVSATLSKFTVEDALKPVPVTVITKATSPAVLESGEMELVVGTGLLTVKVWLFDVPPPGDGFTTVIGKVP